MDDKTALKGSHAGLRFIALLTIYNRGDLERLRAYITENFADEALESTTAEQHVDQLQAMFEQSGRQKVKQVLATNEYHVVVMTQAEAVEGFHYIQLRVEEDYPHKIIEYAHNPLGMNTGD